jgi:hypothetical protein
MTEHRWRERDIDNALMLALASDAPSEPQIKELVERGADVNSVKDDQSVVMDAMVWLQDGLDERFIRLLVDVGADVNYLSDDGGCPLIGACLSGSPALVEFFLQRGVNPNIVCDFSDSVLGAVDTDLAYHELEVKRHGALQDVVMVERLTSIIAVLTRHGAKGLGELRADHVSRWIRIFGSGGTGLLTGGGYIEVDAIAELPDGVRLDFKAWKDAFWDSWPNSDWSSRPPLFNRAKHNEWGRRLSRVIRATLPSDIAVMYLTISADYERSDIRSVDSETIE